MFEMHKSILAVTPVDHPKLKSRLRSYDDTMFKLYLSFGQKDALEEAIRASEYIINIPDQSSEGHARNVWILAQRLVQRYLRTGTSADLDDSIRACQQAVDDTPISSKNRQRRLQSLCDRLGEKYSQTLEEADFQAAKVVVDQILNHLPMKPRSRARSLGNIGIILSLRYRQTGHDDHFQLAIRVASEAVDLTADGEIGVLSDLVTLVEYMPRHITRLETKSDSKRQSGSGETPSLPRLMVIQTKPCGISILQTDFNYDILNRSQLMTSKKRFSYIDSS